MAAITTSYDVKSGDESVLAVPIDPTQTTGIVIAEMNMNGEPNTAWANTSGGVIQVEQVIDGTRKVEWIAYGGGTLDSDNAFTLSDVSRDVSRTGSSLTGSGTGQRFSKGATVKLVTFHFLLNKKGNLDRANTWTAANTFSGAVTFNGAVGATVSLTVPVYANAAARDAAIPSPSNGMEVYLTSEGYFTDRIGGAWVVRTADTTANGSTTVAGRFEEATVAEQGTSTAAGATGARLVPAVANLVKTSSGASDENKIAILNSQGAFDSGFLPVIGYVFGDGSDGDVTLSMDTTLTRDMFYDDLNLSTFTLHTAGYRVYVKGTLSGSGKIKATTGATGGTGGNASGGTGGSAGSAGASSGAGSLPGTIAGVAGGAGVNGVSSNGNGTNGNAGTAGGALTNSIASTSGTAGGASGAGGNGNGSTGGTAGAGGAAGTATAAAKQNVSFYEIFATFSGGTWTTLNSIGKGGGGGGGGSGGRNATTGSSGAGGGGGGSGASGGFFYIAARTLTGTWNIESIGGAGGAGGNGGNSGADTDSGGGGGGGGGAGGPGGCGILVKTNSTGWSGTSVLTGGAGGAGGTGGTKVGIGVNGAAGSSGNTGSSGTLLTVTVS